MGMSKAAGELIDRISDGEINQPQRRALDERTDEARGVREKTRSGRNKEGKGGCWVTELILWTVEHFTRANAPP